MKLIYLMLLVGGLLYSMEEEQPIVRFNGKCLNKYAVETMLNAYQEESTHPMCIKMCEILSENYASLSAPESIESIYALQNEVVAHPSHKKAIERYLKATQMVSDAYKQLKKVETGLISQTWKDNGGDCIVPETGEPKDLIKSNPMSTLSKDSPKELMVIFGLLSLRKQERLAFAQSCTPRE